MSTQISRTDLRLATISALVRQAAPHALGRTAIMKLVYFLQTLRGVPLEYDFRIYTYGPYDSQVLEDLKVAELKGAVKSSVVGYSVGMGYAITPGTEVESLVGRSPSINAFLPDIASIVSEFGERSATDLEMASTIVFVTTENRPSQGLTISEAARKVKEMKPRLDLDRIVQEAGDLKKSGYIFVD